MTLRTYLDCAYALAVEERVLASQTIDRAQLVKDLEGQLGEPLPDEVAPLDFELMRRKRDALANQAAIDRLTGIATLEKARD